MPSRLSSERYSKQLTVGPKCDYLFLLLIIRSLSYLKTMPYNNRSHQSPRYQLHKWCNGDHGIFQAESGYRDSFAFTFFIRSGRPIDAATLT